MNRTDAARNEALYRSIYQTQVDLDAQAACPRGHPFADGFIQDDGKVVSIHMNVNVTPQGKVVCRICAAERAVEFRKGRPGMVAE